MLDIDFVWSEYPKNSKCWVEIVVSTETQAIRVFCDFYDGPGFPMLRIGEYLSEQIDVWHGRVGVLPSEKVIKLMAKKFTQHKISNVRCEYGRHLEFLDVEEEIKRGLR